MSSKQNLQKSHNQFNTIDSKISKNSVQPDAGPSDSRYIY